MWAARRISRLCRRSAAMRWARFWARVVARIEPEWAEPLAAHLVKRTYSEPHWDARRGAAVAFEKVTLSGLPIVTERKVNYARVDPAAARALGWSASDLTTASTVWFLRNDSRRVPKW